MSCSETGLLLAVEQIVDATNQVKQGLLSKIGLGTGQKQAPLALISVIFPLAELICNLKMVAQLWHYPHA